MKNVNYKKLILPNIPYVFIGLLATKLGQAAVSLRALIFPPRL